VEWSSKGRKCVKNMEILSAEEMVVVGEWCQKRSKCAGRIYKCDVKCSDVE
jgi:hypothetical protein